ncbi:MAG: iron-containing redox enzyme family protein [Geminicoccaceae bacterium]
MGIIKAMLSSVNRKRFEFSPDARDRAAAILAEDPAAIFHRLISDQESEAAIYAAKQILDATLTGTKPVEHWLCASLAGDPQARDLDRLQRHVGILANDLLERLHLAIQGHERARFAVLRERAPLALIAGCWLDTISQPATQPGLVTNFLYGQHFAWLGGGAPENAVSHARRHALERAGLALPPILDRHFTKKAGSSDESLLTASFYLSLAQFPANYLPELVGIHYAFHALAIDNLLLGIETPLSDRDLLDVVAAFLDEIEGDPSAPDLLHRLIQGITLGIELEQNHVSLLCEVARLAAEQSLDSQVADIIQRHAPFAGRQHGEVRVGKQKLSDIFDDPDFDLLAFMKAFKTSFYLRPSKRGGCPFVKAFKFGGPMFGVFTEAESATFKAWAQSMPSTRDDEIVLTMLRPDGTRAADWQGRIRSAEPLDVVLAEPCYLDNRELFFRLVNIENFPNTREIAKARAEQGLADALTLFTIEGGGRYTDASMFTYTPEALLDRVDDIYWKKLVNPYKPLDTIPPADEVVFGQLTFTLGNLIDGTWAHRVGNIGRFDRSSDNKLLMIYADEMGLGDIRKNHITLVYRVLQSMGIHLPHIREDSFLDQNDIADELYAFAVHQLCLALFPDSHYPEIVGYNLGIEMFGLGELRLHEIQKLKHHGFDPIYEEAHLSIDNVSSGHAQQSAEIVNIYLDEVKHRFGFQRMQEEWERVWAGYASFAQFVERGHGLENEPWPVSESTHQPVEETSTLIL